MDKKWYSAECLGDSVIALGKAGEGEAVRVEIDVSEWTAAYPYAQIKLFVKPPKPGAPYFARIDGPEDGVIGWTLKKSDTQHAGGGVIELMLISGEEVLLKSATARTELLPSPSMSGASEGPPDANETWWEEALEKIDKAKQEAIQSVESAVDRAEEAAAKAEAANENIEETVTDLRHDINALADTIAILHAGVPDTSAKAASHELYATDAPMHVTLYGQTTQAGSGDPSPDNVRPIYGTDLAKVQASGRNIIDFPDIVDQTVTNAYYKGYKTNVVLVPGQTYTISADVESSVDGFYFAVGLGDDKEYRVNLSLPTNLKSGHIVQTFTPMKNNMFGNVNNRRDRLWLRPVGYGAPTTYTYSVKNLMLELGNTEHDYEPYAANVIDMTAALNGEALYEDCTVEHDVLSGCDACLEFDGSSDENWQLSGYGDMVFICSSIIKDTLINVNYPAYSPSLLVLNPQSETQMPGGDALGVYSSLAAMQNGTASIYRQVPGITTVEELRAYLAEHPFKMYCRTYAYTPEKDLRVCKVTKSKRRISANEIVFSSLTNVNGIIFGRLPLEGKNDYDYALLSSEYKPRQGGWANFQNVNHSFNIIKTQIGIRDDAMGSTLEEIRAYFAASDAEFVYTLAAPEVYVTDPIELRKPAGLVPVTVTGSGETEVAYAHDTKHYIDSQIAAVVALAMNG